MLAEPFGAVISLVLGLIGVIPCAVERRQRLSRDMGPRPDAAIRRRGALLSESGAGQKGKTGGDADEGTGFEHRSFPLNSRRFQTLYGDAGGKVSSPIAPRFRGVFGGRDGFLPSRVSRRLFGLIVVVATVMT